MKQTFTILLLLTLATLSQSQVIFYSNIEEASSIVTELQSESANAEMISLGDNAKSVVKTISKKGIKMLGDKDVDLLKVDGHFNFDGVKKKSLCPGPIVEELDDNHVLIVVNSNWVLDQEYIYNAANEDCDIFNHIHMMEELEGVMEDYEDWNKIVVAHHPIKSITELDGKGMAWLNVIPVYGQLRGSFKRNSGNNQDMPHPEYQKYIHVMEKVLGQFDKTVFISGHDRLNTVIQDELTTFINVNTGNRDYRSEADKHTQYRSKGAQYLMFDKGQFTFVGGKASYTVKDPFKTRKEETKQTVALPETVSNISTASEKYHPTGWKNFWMGSGYRDAWSEPVKAPLLNISEYDGGMKPYAIGGGLQTMSVKLKSNNGKKYAFRVLDKQPEKSLNEVLQNSIYKNITQELITTMHPYAPLVANALFDATDIIHIKPELYILDKNHNLGSQYNPYIGKIGTLEEKPKGKGKNREGFYGADKVVTSWEMLLDMRKSPDAKMDKMAYAKARLMDMFIGDWDRHEDNWKWAMYKEDGKHIYKPIPKDRDHTFSHWTGLIPNIADIIIMNAEDFNYKFGNLRQLNFKARYLDRQLATEIDEATWLEAVAYIQSKMTDEVIDNAVLQFPPEVRYMHAATIAAKLKSRREDLPRAMKEYYAELSSEVQVAASNKKDLVKIDRHQDGNVQVRMYHMKDGKAKSEAYYDRTFEHGIVKKIYLFGLDGKDQFEVNGSTDQSIKVEIIGGNGEDKIIDNSEVRKGGKALAVFDTKREDNISSSNKIEVKHPSRDAHYDPYTFDFNWLIPRGTIRRSSGNGWGFGAGFSYLTRGFNKSNFVDRYDFLGVYYPELGAYRLDAGYTRRDAIGRNDLFVKSRFTTLYDQFPFFYGIGNETEVIRLERRERNRIDYDYFDIETGLKRQFYTKSLWENSLVFERHKVLNYNDLNVISQDLPGYGTESFVGARSKLTLDFTDSSLYPKDGSQFDIRLDARSSFDGDFSGNVSTRFAHYKTVNLGIQTTFAGAVHYKQAFGDSNFYHFSRLGSQSHFRGYTRNRFIDRYAFLYNSEIRFNLGAIQTPLIRFFVGVFAFYDGGQVWSDDSEFLQKDWNNSYGGGIFLSPGWEQFAITFTVGRPDDDFTYSKLQLGFDF